MEVPKYEQFAQGTVADKGQNHYMAPNSPLLSSAQILSHHAMRLSAVTLIACKGPSVLPNSKHIFWGNVASFLQTQWCEWGHFFLSSWKSPESEQRVFEAQEAGRGTLVMQTAAQHAWSSQGHQSSEKEYHPPMKTVHFILSPSNQPFTASEPKLFTSFPIIHIRFQMKLFASFAVSSPVLWIKRQVVCCARKGVFSWL